MPHVQVGNRLLHVQRRGTGAPLLLIQGMAGHHGMWGEAFLDRLAADFDVVSYDHRGIGESVDASGGPFSIADLAGDAVEVLDAMGFDRAHVLGISMGGMVAQELALQEPARVDRLVLGCTYCGGPDATFTAPGPLRMMQAMDVGDLESALRTTYEVNLSPAFTADTAHWAPFRAAALSVAVPVAVVLQQARAAFVHDTSDRLPSLAAPTLVLHGTADRMIDHANSAMVAGLVPDARRVDLDGVGHLFWWERPDETAELVRDHLLPD